MVVYGVFLCEVTMKMMIYKLYNSCGRRMMSLRRKFLTMCTQKVHEEKISKQGHILRSQCGRSERAECGADTKTFLSNVYKRSTRARKRQVDATQYGRSMVEMLGVLAIVGVLSVGGIAGYSKAMNKYKLNKQAEQISTLINAGLRYAGKWNFETTTTNTSYFIKLGEIPKEMIKSNTNNNIYDVFDTAFSYLYTINTDDNTKYTQLFIYLDTSKNDDYSLSICRNIITSVKEFHDNIRQFGIVHNNTDTNSWFGSHLYGDKYCTSEVSCLKDVTISQIDTICRYNAGQSKDLHLKILWDE